MCNLEYGTNEPIYKTNRLTDLEIRLVVAKGGDENWEFGIIRCKLLYIGWINKVLLYSTGNYIQYPVISHNRKYKNKKCLYE